jgi:hypothetical protein
MYNLLNGETRTVDVTARSAGLTGTLNRSIGVSFDSPRAYLMVHSATATQRRVFEFADDTFETLLNTYDFSSQATNITNGCFVVFGDRFFSMNNNGMESGSFVNNVAQIVHNHTACPYNTTITSGTARYITIRDGKFYTLAASGGTGDVTARNSVWDLATMTQIATIGTISHSISSTPNILGVATDPTLGDRMFLYVMPGLYGSAAYDFYTNQALAAYVLPNDAPQRPPGTGMRVAYQIDVMF